MANFLFRTGLGVVAAGRLADNDHFAGVVSPSAGLNKDTRRAHVRPIVVFKFHHIHTQNL